MTESIPSRSILERHSEIPTWLVLGIPLVVMLVLAMAFPTGIAEDAYITLRYARNISQGHGFVWNEGESPVWGSTSFLWTVILGILGMMGVELTQAARFLSALLGGMSLALIALFGKRVLDASTFSVFLAMILFSTSIVVGHILTGFDTILFAFLSLLTFELTFVGSRPEYDHSAIRVGHFLSGLALAMSRPEGVIIATTSVILLLAIRRHDNWKPIVKMTLIPLLFSLVTYYGFMMLYFGNWLPNPFSIKAPTATIRPWSVLQSLSFLSNGVNAAAIVLIGAWLLKNKSDDMIRNLLVVTPWVLYYAAYWSISQTQNVLMRFQFPIVPIMLTLLPLGLDQIFSTGLERGIRIPRLQSLDPEKAISALLIMGISISLVGVQLATTLNQVPYQEGEDKARVGMFLSIYQDINYLMVVTEAGMLPYYSGWRVLDAVGLNDVIIARNGFSIEYVAQANPQIIQFHEYYSADNLIWARSNESWNTMTYSLRGFCLDNNYTLACIVRYSIRTGFNVNEEGYQWYFVRPDFLHSSEIIEGLSSLPELDYEYSFSENHEVRLS